MQSASLELDEYAAIVSYEEYHPYGTTAFQAKSTTINAVAKRYRYTGKERDEESGLYYHGARYYIPWLCRWTSPDPINNENYNIAQGYGLAKNKGRHFLHLTASSYEYCKDNPVKNIDPNGEQEVPIGDDIEDGGQLAGVSVIAEKKRSFWEKAGAFAKGFAKGVIITAAVIGTVALVAATGPVGLLVAGVATKILIGVDRKSVV